MPTTVTSLQGLDGLPGALLAILAAGLVAYLLALAVGRLLRVTLIGLLGRQGMDPRMLAAALRPVRVVRHVTFVVLSTILAFFALELAGHRTPVGVRRETLLAWLTDSGIRIVLIALVAWLLVHLAGSVATRIEREVSNELGPDAAERRKRVYTLTTLISNLLGILFTTAAALMILRELRVDILPLLAGAGIVGLAIGFGAQSLVKDVISGFFMIFENQIRVGDVAVINGQGGLVEALTLRTIVLRAVDGTVHVFPNGNVTTLANQTKDYSFALLDINVRHDEDPDRVIDVLRGVAEDLRTAPEWTARILAPLEVFGIEGFTESAMTIRARLKTVPLAQWDVARELRRRIKRAFDDARIEMSAPLRVMHLPRSEPPGNKDPKTPERA